MFDRVCEGRAPAIQYMPNKHHTHFGLKLFCLCESDTGYTVSFSIYDGKSDTTSEYGISHEVCIQLMEPLLGMGYHLYTDNWYTAVPLAEPLLSEGSTLTGTVRGNRKYLPQGVSQKLSKGDSIAYCKEKLVCIGWQYKKHVILLSTKGLSKMINYTSQKQILDCYYQKALHLGCCSSPRSASASKRNREHQCPEIVRNYNLHMCGADLSDMRCYMFLDKRRTIRWNK